MTDAKVTIERETLQAALDALELTLRCAETTFLRNHENSQIERSANALRAALAAQPAEPCMDTVLRNAARRSAKIVDRGRMVKPVEPVAWLHIQGNHTEPSLWRLDADEITRGWTEVPLYAAPPAPAAVPMTDEQIDAIAYSLTPGGFGGQIDWHRRFARAVLAAGDKP